MKATEIKEPGFYWVQDAKGAWIVVEFDGEQLSMTRGECPWLPAADDDGDYIGPIDPPAL
ncbi:hypothetical protein D3C85_1054620 [compost metagenome]